MGKCLGREDGVGRPSSLPLPAALVWFCPKRIKTRSILDYLVVSPGTLPKLVTALSTPVHLEPFLQTPSALIGPIHVPLHKGQQMMAIWVHLVFELIRSISMQAWVSAIWLSAKRRLIAWVMCKGLQAVRRFRGLRKMDAVQDLQIAQRNRNVCKSKRCL